MRALRSVLRPPLRRRRGRGRAGRGSGLGPGGAPASAARGGNGCGRGRGGGLGPDSSGSPTESSASESSDADLFWKDIMASLLKKTRKKLKPSSKQQKTASGQVEPEPEASGQVESKPKASRREARNRDYVPAVGGGSCYFEAYPVGATGKLYDNWMFVCPRLGRKGCFKTKGVYPASTRRHDEL